MRNAFFCLLIGILLLGCSEENPSDVFVNSANGESSSSFIAELSSSDIANSSSSEDFAISSSSFGAISNTTETSSSSWPQYSYGQLIDERDGQFYKTIKIGEQIWMAENLNYAYLQSTSTKDSSSECFNNEPDTCAKYGRLYLWSAAMDSAGIFSLDGKGCGLGSGSCKAQPSKGVRGVCPENWHIPTESDMNNYINYANSSQEAINSVRYYWFDRFIQLDYTKPNINQKYAFLWSSVDLYGIKFDENSVKVIDFTDIDNLVGTDLSYRADSHAIRCVKDEDTIHVEHGELKDERDGQVYKTVKIGNQTWMAENLNFVDTQNTENFKSSCYNNEPDSCTKYGRLYRWRTVMAGRTPNLNDYDFKARGICPEKWHVPSFNEWKTLVDIVNNFATDLKSKDGWINDGNGADSFGFNVLPSGYRSPWLDSKWGSLGELACFWTTLPWSDLLMSTTSIVRAFSACFSSDRKDIFFYYDDDEEPILTDYDEAPLRCVKDSTEAE